MGSWSERTSSRATAGGPGPVSWQPADWARWWLADWEVPHSPENKPGGTTGEQDKPGNPGLQRGEMKPQTSD